MNFVILIRVALRSLVAHPLRSLLTMLGVIIGVVSIISVRSIGEGAKVKVAQQIQSLGSNFVIVLAGSPKNRSTGGGRGGTGLLTLKKKEYDAVVLECTDILRASPGLGTLVSAINENQNWKTTLVGTNEEFQEIRSWPCVSGEFFNMQDVRSANKVALVGLTVARQLFGSEDPTGKKIRINSMPFTILGVLSEKGKRPDGRDEDDMIYAPWTTVQKKVMGLTEGFSVFIFSAKSKELTEKLTNDIRSILRQQRKLGATEEDDFSIFSQDEIARASDHAQAALNLLLLIIASISLLVGGIGIMNIMLVSVSERTREIGIRLALGAQTYSILVQFVLEAVTICFFGGVIGILLGIALAYTVASFLSWPVFISLASILVGLGSSICIGLFFGYYPARTASLLNPVDALAER